MNMERVAIYCRVSGQEQLKEGYSLQEQETRLKLFCESKGWSVHKTYIDGAMSGSNMERPALQELIRDAERHEISKVCVYKLDRLSRSQKDTLYLIEDVFLKNKVDFVSMSETLDTSTPLGMAMIGILSVFAQLERSNINERMTMGRDARARSGKYRGGGNLPIGYKKGDSDNLVIDEYEAAIVRDVYRDFIGGKSASSIAKKFNEINIRNGRSWTASKICRIMKQPLYIGLMRWKGETLRVINAPPIIDEDTFNAAQAEIARRSKNNERPQTQYPHATLLGGLVWCGKCGSRYIAFNDTHKGRESIHRFYCASKMYRHQKQKEYVCENKGIRADNLEEIVIGEIRKITLDPSLLFGSENAEKQQQQKRKAIAGRIADIGKALDKLIDLYSIDGIDIQAVAKRTKELKTERENLEQQLEGMEDQQPSRADFNSAIEKFKELTESEEFDKMSLYYVVRKLIRSITIDGKDIRIEWNI